MTDDALRLVQALEELSSLTEEQSSTSVGAPASIPAPTQTEELFNRFTANVDRILEDTMRARQREVVLLDISDCLMRLYAHNRSQPACEVIASLMRDWRLLRVNPVSTALKIMRNEVKNEDDLHEMRSVIAKLREMQRETFGELKASTDGLTSKQRALLKEALATARTLVN